MNADRKIDIEIFNAALAIESASERERYLDKTCGADPERRHRIEALLEAYANSYSLIDADAQNPHAKSSEVKP